MDSCTRRSVVEAGPTYTYQGTLGKGKIATVRVLKMKKRADLMKGAPDCSGGVLTYDNGKATAKSRL